MERMSRLAACVAGLQILAGVRERHGAARCGGGPSEIGQRRGLPGGVRHREFPPLGHAPSTRKVAEANTDIVFAGRQASRAERADNVR